MVVGDSCVTSLQQSPRARQCSHSKWTISPCRQREEDLSDTLANTFLIRMLLNAFQSASADRLLVASHSCPRTKWRNNHAAWIKQSEGGAVTDLIKVVRENALMTVLISWIALMRLQMPLICNINKTPDVGLSRCFASGLFQYFLFEFNHFAHQTLWEIDFYLGRNETIFFFFNHITFFCCNTSVGHSEMLFN